MHHGNMIVFICRCTGMLSPSQKPCRLGNVEAALRSVDQTISLLGPNHHDPRLQPNGKVIFALKQQFQAYSKADPPATQVDPLPPASLNLGSNFAGLAPQPVTAVLPTWLLLISSSSIGLVNTPLHMTMNPSNSPMSISTYLTSHSHWTPPFSNSLTSWPSPLIPKKTVPKVRGKIGHDGCSTSTTFGSVTLTLTQNYP